MIQEIQTSHTPSIAIRTKSDLLTQVFKKTLLETAVTTVIVAIAAAVIISTGGSGIAFLAISAGSMLLFNAAVRTIMAKLVYDNQFTPTDNKKILIEALSYIAPISFGLVNANALDISVHQLGHTAAKSLLFDAPDGYWSYSRLVFSDGGYVNMGYKVPFWEGAASNIVHGFHGDYWVGRLTPVGNIFGFYESIHLYDFAGPALSLLTSTAMLIGSYAIEDSHPEVSKYLFFGSIINIASQAFAALLAGIKNVGSEYTFRASDAIIGPLVSAAGIVAIPIIVKLAFVAGYYIKQRALSNATNQI